MRTVLMLLVLVSGPVLAHPGHGEETLHWHAFEAWGWALALAMAAAGLWWSRRK